MPVSAPKKDMTRIGRSSMADWDAFAPAQVTPSRLTTRQDTATELEAAAGPSSCSKHPGKPLGHAQLPPSPQAWSQPAWSTPPTTRTSYNPPRAPQPPFHEWYPHDPPQTYAAPTYALPPSTLHTRLPGDRLVSSATVIDYGSPAHSNIAHELPVHLPPPPQTASLQQQPESSTFAAPLNVLREPSRSTIRRAPSPVIIEHHRHQPYPLPAPSKCEAVKVDGLAQSLAPDAAADVAAAPPTRPEIFNHMDKELLNKLVTAPLVVPPNTTHGHKQHTRKFSATHVRRPRNSFILFRSHVNAQINLFELFDDVKHHTTASKVIGSLWGSLSLQERAGWDRLAEMEKKAHQEEFPEYRYKPKSKGHQDKASPKKNKSGAAGGRKVLTPKRGKRTKLSGLKEVDSEVEEDQLNDLDSDDDAEFEFRVRMQDAGHQRTTRSQTNASTPDLPKTVLLSESPSLSPMATPKRQRAPPPSAARTPTSSGRKSRSLTKSKPYSSPTSGRSIESSPRGSPSSSDAGLSTSPHHTVERQPRSPLSDETALDRGKKPKSYGALSNASGTRTRPSLRSMHGNHTRQASSILRVPFPLDSPDVPTTEPGSSKAATVSHTRMYEGRPRGVTPSILDPLELFETRFAYDNSLLVPQPDRSTQEKPKQASRIASVGSRWFQQQEDQLQTLTKANEESLDRLSTGFEPTDDVWLSRSISASLQDVEHDSLLHQYQLGLSTRRPPSTTDPRTLHLTSTAEQCGPSLAPDPTLDLEGALFDFEEAVKVHQAADNSFHVGQRDMFVNPSDVFGPL
ncbi:hypothetical protein ACM66B_000512 [Microbotryomycetes sp. NB124-2]